MKLRSLSMILFCICVSFKTFADSPLTSTLFSKAYQDEKIIKQAAKAKGILTEKLIVYLLGKHPIDVKIALINELSWDINNKTNSIIFFTYLKEHKKYTDGEDFLAKASADEILCMAYLLVLDNYFEVDEAAEFAEIALSKNPKSYTFQIITALIKAQQAMSGNWCEVFTLTDNVRKNENLKKDMKPEAIAIIFEYMDIYKEECE